MNARLLTRMFFTAALILTALSAFNQMVRLGPATLGALIFPAANAAEGTAPSPSDTVLTVNNATFTARDIASHMRMLQNEAQGQPPLDRDSVIQLFVSRELLYQEAVAKGLDKNPDIVADIENGRRRTLANALAFSIMNDTRPSDEQLRAFYQQNVVANPLKEFKAKHIVVNTEDKAKEIIAALDKGGSFAALAKEKSDGPTANTGGDLGWLSFNDMVPPIAEAIANMSKGAYTKQPVQTQFGWHVILLEDTRVVAPPPFDAIRDRIRVALQQKALEEHIGKMRSQAKIQIK